MAKLTPSRQIAASLLERDGNYDIDGDPVTFDWGYQVGGVVKSLVNPTLQEATRWVAAQREAIRKSYLRPLYFGSWTDKEGNVYLDITDHHQLIGRARTWANVRGEKAIWDWTNGKEIEV